MMNKFYKLCIVCLMVMSIACSPATGVSNDTGSLAANFSATDINGNPVALVDYLGKKSILLVFFADWCPPCRREIPQLIAIHNTYAERGLQVVAVSLDNARSILPDFIERNNINYTVWHDTNKTAAQVYEVVGIPTNILIDQEGTIVFRAHHVPSSKEIEILLD